MKKYLFIDFHNGHEKTYHPFLVNKSLSQEKATALMEKFITVPYRMGVSFGTFLNVLESQGYCPLNWTCDCCKTFIEELTNPNVEEWDIIEGISGNY